MSNAASQGCVLILDKEGNFDAGGKVLKNLANPTEINDCVTKQYVDNCFHEYKKTYTSIKQHIEQLNNRINELESVIKDKKKNTYK